MGQFITDFVADLKKINLIVSSASRFWDFRIPPFIYIGLGLVWAAWMCCKYGGRVKKFFATVYRWTSIHAMHQRHSSFQPLEGSKDNNYFLWDIKPPENFTAVKDDK